MDTKVQLPESFSVDHTTMTAPVVRKASLSRGPSGDLISKFDMRFVKPNTQAIPTAAIHTLEHLLALYMRAELDGLIDISPMGCRTGFYLLIWGDIDPNAIRGALIASLKKIVNSDWKDVPGTTAKQCGNYRDHSLFSAKEFATMVLTGFGES